MKDDYSIDLRHIALEDYKRILEIIDLTPSRKMIIEDIESRLSILKNHNINNLEELLRRIAKDNQMKSFARETGLPEEYLILLKREINSYSPKPVSIRDFPFVEEKVIIELEKAGITNSKSFYEKAKSKKGRMELSQETGLSYEIILEITQLVDLVRVRWVGATFSKMIYDAGVRSPRELMSANAIELHERLMKINQANKYTKGRFSVNDTQLCINFAKILPKGIEY